MVIIDASVNVSLVNADDAAHASSWFWFEQAQAEKEKIVALVIRMAEVASAISRGAGDPDLARLGAVVTRLWASWSLQS